MDNLPGDPSNPNSGNNNPVPPFGSNFNPHTNPPDPSNPYASQPPMPQLPQQPSSQPSTPPYLSTPNLPNYPNVPELPDNPDSVKHEHYSEAAQHKLRDEHGRFAHTQTAPSSQPIPNPSYPSNPSTPYIPSDLPKPESSFKQCIKYIVKIKWTKVTFYIVGFIGVVNVIINLPPIKNSINQLFPNSSPVFAREISIQGTLRTSETGIYTLVLPDQQAYILKFKPSASLTNLKKLNEVVIKGNLTWTPYVIENAEVYPLNISSP